MKAEARPSALPGKRVLIVDDQALIRRSLADYLAEWGCETATAADGVQGLAQARAQRFDVVLVDLRMPRLDGLELVTILQDEQPELPTIVVSGKGVLQDAVEAIRRGAWDYVTKPIRDMKELALVIERVLEKAHLRAERDQYRRELEALNRSLEAEVARQTKKLAQANAELERFIYVSSHDLQEPLRMVTSFLQLLQKKYRGNLDAEADEFITFATDGAMRMRDMIRGLLAYSRVNTRGKPFAETDSKKSLDYALRSLRPKIEETDAVVTHDPLPTVMVDGVQLGQAFEYLIDNALTFCDREPARIHVSAERQGQAWCFSVSDNGIGIDTQDAEQIFDIFQRLHTQAEYPGVGAGLAICKKIVERHGGRIWVESSVDQGATFYFTIPAEEAV